MLTCVSPWFDLRGWLGIGNHLLYALSLCLCWVQRIELAYEWSFVQFLLETGVWSSLSAANKLSSFAEILCLCWFLCSWSLLFVFVLLLLFLCTLQVYRSLFCQIPETEGTNKRNMAVEFCRLYCSCILGWGWGVWGWGLYGGRERESRYTPIQQRKSFVGEVNSQIKVSHCTWHTSLYRGRGMERKWSWVNS